jgi:hypothetical protein
MACALLCSDRSFSWIVTCVLTYHPITAKYYQWTPQTSDVNESQAPQYHENELWYKAAQVIQSITGLLTIPLTSAVCSNAAVVYLQHSASRRPPKVTLRQMTVLADKGWASIGTYVMLVTGQWDRYSSSFLVWAVFLHVLGSIISPLQQIFISTETIKTPTSTHSAIGLLDIPDKFGQEEQIKTDVTVALTRQSLASTSNDDYLSQLWSGSVDCPGLMNMSSAEFILCTQGGTNDDKHVNLV